MDAVKNELDILTWTSKDGVFLKNLLLCNINERLKINLLNFEEGVNEIRTTPVVLISGEFLREEAQKFYPESRIIAAKRIINGQNLEKVMVLPKDKKTLVINHPKEVTIETITSLRELGLNHLNYVPYWPGQKINLDDVDTAISPGHIHLCPGTVKNKIDLGRRTISFSTFLEILLCMNLDLKNIDNFARYHIQLMIQAGNKVADLLLSTEKLSRNLEVIVNKIRDSIIAIDENDCISAFNPASEDLFHLKYEDVIGKNYSEVFREYPEFVRLMLKETPVYEALFDVKSKKIVGSITYIKNNKGKSRICALNEVSTLQKIEANVRRKLNKKGYVAKYTFDSIRGTSISITKTVERAKKFAGTDLTVLITGESGTGKELFAQAMHNASSRCDGPFIGINFAAIPENLVESELFGYEEGAFTGALKGGKTGLFEQAHNGTIFLDEIGDAPSKIQSRLLRVLQEREVMRLGASKVIPIDVRVIAATNKDLSHLVEQGVFRRDLYYRLNVLPITIPPLRQRKTDIPEIVRSIIDAYNSSILIPEEVMNILKEYNWPGNVRELENVIQYLTVVSNNRIITVEDLPPRLTGSANTSGGVSGTVSILANENSFKEFQFILDEIYKANKAGRMIGRNKIAELSRGKNLNLTDAKVKSRLKKLEQMGLVRTGKTRQGSCITDKGIEMIRGKG